MSPAPRIIYEQPNIENTIPFTLYQASTPENFEDSDKFIIYGGGPFYSLTGLTGSDIQLTSELTQVNSQDISLFVLNTCFIIWFNSNSIGVEFPYQSIVLHAINEDPQGYTLYLQILFCDIIKNITTSDYVSYVNLNITPVSPSTPNMTTINKLFNQVKDFGIVSIYEALSKCSSLHYDTESEEETIEPTFRAQPPLNIPNAWFSHSNGTGDDLDDIPIEEDIIVNAGMNVDVGYAQIAGSIRQREENLENVVKTRRLV